MPNYWKFEIPYVPLSLNRLNTMHYMERARAKKAVETDIYYLVREAKALPPKPLEKAKIRITYYFKYRRKRDLVDNFSPKFLMDSLVKAGVLVDDNTGVVGIPELCQGEDDRNFRTDRTVVEIWEVGDSVDNIPNL